MTSIPILLAGLLLGRLLPAGTPEPGAWRTVELPADRGIVSCMAAIPGGFALGTTSGGLQLLDSSFRIDLRPIDPSGRVRNVSGLAWAGGALWLASDDGLLRWSPGRDTLDRNRSDVPVSVRPSVRAVAASGLDLWVATPRSVGCVRPGRPESWREWKLPLPAGPTTLLRVGGRLLVGTESRGLLVLDSASSGWVRFGRAEGLSSDQVTGMEWIGAEVFVATPEGLDVLDLSSQKVRPLLPGVEVSWLAQSNGWLFAETSEGILSLDPATRHPSALELPAGLASEGAVFAGRERLVVACGTTLAVRPHSTFLGEAPLEMAQEGFSLALPRPLPSRVQVQAFLRIPEWPEAKMPLSVESLDGGARILIRTTPEAKGLVQVDLLAKSDGKVAEVRSVEGVADRSKPILSVDSMRAWVRDTVAEIRGRVRGVGPLVLVRSPGSSRIALSPDGTFRERLRLARGVNRFELALEDALGNRAVREIALRRDDQPPRLDAVPDDTVAGDFARVRVPVHEEGEVSASVRGPGQCRASAFDSFVVVEARGLSAGTNLVVLTVEDEAGNSASRTIRIVRTPPQGGGAFSSSWSVDDYRAFPPQGPLPVATESVRGVVVVHYSMLEGETLCGVAESFYGSQSLAPVLIRWNGFADSSQWRRMPVGTPVDVPFWRDVDYRNPDVRGILESFPWDRVPQARGRR